MNESVYPREESHGVCHGCGASSGSIGMIPPPQRRRCSAAAAAIPARAAGRGGRGSHLCESDRSSLRGTSLPPRRQRESYLDDSRSPAAPLSPGPLAPCRGHAAHRSGRPARRRAALYATIFSSMIQPTGQPTNFSLCATDFSVTAVQIFNP